MAIEIPKGYTVFSEVPCKNARVIKAINERGNEIFTMFKLNDKHKFINNGISSFSSYSTPGLSGIRDLTMYDSYGRVLATGNNAIREVLTPVRKYGIKVQAKEVR